MPITSPISSISALPNPILCLIEVTQDCELRCPVCFRKNSKQFSASVSAKVDKDEIIMYLKELIRLRPDINPTIAFTGGEPTLHDDLPELVAKAHEIGYKRTEVMTNGLRIADDLNYAKELKRAGVNQLGLQFDGFDDEAYIKLRGMPLTEIKLGALDNLKRVKQRTILAACILKGINEDQIGPIIEYAVQNKEIIEHVNLQTFIRNEYNSPYFQDDHYLSKEEVLIEIEKQMNGKIKRNTFSTPSFIQVIPEFIETFTHKPQNHFFPNFHPECNATTYLYVTKKQELISVFEALDVFALLEYLKYETSRLKDDDSIMRRIRVMVELAIKMFSLIKVNVFRKILLKSIRNREFDPLADLDEILMISCENYMDSKHLSDERNVRCGLFYLMKDSRIAPFCQQCNYIEEELL